MASLIRNCLAASVAMLLVLAGSLGVASSDASNAPAGARAQTGVEPPAPTRGATRTQTLFGLDVPSLGQLDASESALGTRAAIVGTFSDWAHSPDFPLAFAHEVNRRGAILLVSWEPWDSWRGGAAQPRYALRRIVAGDFDGMIYRWASQIARYRLAVMLRFAPEMNGDWLPWSTGVNGNRPGDYVAAWRHVRARFRRAGAGNVVWVWNPTVAYDGSTPLHELFPGSGQVDWLAVDGYNWGGLRGWGWQSFDDIFAPTIATLRTLAPARPVMIAETGAPPDPRKPAWVADTLHAARARNLGAVVWFEFDKETDWRLAGDPSSARAAHAVLMGGGWRRGGDLPAVEKLLKRSTS